MTVAIKGLQNKTGKKVYFGNPEHESDYRVVERNQSSDAYAWVPQHEDKGITLYIEAFDIHWVIWDSDWRINGRSSKIQHPVILVNGVQDRADYRVTVAENGDLYVAKH